MDKKDSLRAAITAALPERSRDPDLFKVFVDKGRIVSRRTPALHFEYCYRIILLLLDYTGNFDALMVPLLLWIRQHQPQLLLDFAAEDSAIAFEAEILDDAKADVQISFELSESVTCIARDDGSGYDLVHIPEPDFTAALGDDPLGGGPVVLLKQIWKDGARIVPDTVAPA